MRRGQGEEKGEWEGCIEAYSCIITGVLLTAYCQSGGHVLRCLQFSLLSLWYRPFLLEPQQPSLLREWMKKVHSIHNQQTRMCCSCLFSLQLCQHKSSKFTSAVCILHSWQSSFCANSSIPMCLQFQHCKQRHCLFCNSCGFFWGFEYLSILKIINVRGVCPITYLSDNIYFPVVFRQITQ